MWAGIRYNDFDEQLVDGNTVNMNASFDGWRGMLGAQVNRSFCGGALFARGRTAILMSDARVLDFAGPSPEVVHLLDSTQGMTEIALGYEVSACMGRATITASIAGEWQNWYNYSSNFSTGVSDTSRSDVGFGGIVISTGVEF